MSLLTLSEYKAYLDIGGSSQDTELQNLVDSAEQQIKTFLNRDLESATYTEYYDGSGTSELVLKQFPITSITSISYWDGDSWVALTSSDYDRQVIDTSSVFLDGYTFSKGILNYKIVYDAGYSTIPDDILLAAKELAKLIYDDSPLKNNTLGRVNYANAAGENISYDLEAVNKILNRIKGYRCSNI